MKMLIVDDNRLLADSLRDFFQDTFVVDIAEHGKRALELTKQITYDVILLDLNLPDMHGSQVCMKLRDQNIVTPIIAVTGDRTAERCIDLLGHGADDYITKPFNISILRARIEALMRRGQVIATEPVLTVKDVVIHLDSRRLERAGQTIRLRKKEFDILAYLVRNKGTVVTRRMIMHHVWEVGKEGWEATVDVHIKYLRDKIDKPFDSKIIETVYGVGYMVND